MTLIGKHWEPDGRDVLSPVSRLILSIVVTGIAGFLLEYIGIEILHAFHNTVPETIYFVIAIWAFGLGPLLVLFRKSNILVPMVIVASVFAFLVLYNHNHFIIWTLENGSFIDSGKLISPRIWEFSENAFFGIKNPLLIALIAGVIESIVVPASVWTQKLLTLKLKPNVSPPLDELKDFFDPSVTSMGELKPKRDFGFYFMRFIFIAYGVYFSYQIVGLLVNGKGLPLMSMFFINPPENINTFMKIILMLSLATVAAFNKNVRKEAAFLLLIGHVISVSASLGLYMGYDVNPLFPGDHQFLLASVVGDGFLILFLLYYALAPNKDKPEIELLNIELQSPASTIYRNFFLGFGILFTIFSAGIIYFRVFASPESSFGAVFGGPDPLVSNSLTKYGTLAVIGYFLYFKPSIRKYVVPTLILAFSISVIATIIYGFQGSTQIISRLGTTVTIPEFMTLHIVVDGTGLILLLALRKFFYHVDFQITSLRPGSAECVMALHKSFRASTPNDGINSREVLKRIDEHIVELKSRKRGLVSFPFWIIENIFPLLCWFRPQFSLMSRDECRWMLRRYLLRTHYERPKSAVPFISDLMYQITDVVHALVTLTYFTSTPGQMQTGYILPNARERLQADVAVLRPPLQADSAPLPVNKEDKNWQKPFIEPKGLPLVSPRVGISLDGNPVPDEVDYCIIGSGAAGGVLAYNLAKSKGKDNSIIVVERGKYFSPRQDFSDDELRMIRTLYTEGGLQNTRSFDFTILQAECVGGTTVINNAICIEMPEVSRDEWETFGIDTSFINKQYETVQTEINIDVLKNEAVNQSVESKFIAGIKGYNSNFKDNGYKLSEAERLRGNFSNCLGCGLCNIGCSRMRKMSVLETYIPWAQALGVKVFSNMGAVQCETETHGEKKKVKNIIVRQSNGEFRRIKIRKAVIVSAGAVASSRFLLRSELGGENVGKGLACNFAMPPLVEFDEDINAFDGTQITMFASPDSYEAIFETSFNPPGAYSITFPLYFNGHDTMMKAYKRTANFTALVGSDPTGTVSKDRDIIFGRAIDWNQSENDLFRVKKALATIVRFSKEAGAQKIILPTNPALVINLNSPVDQTLEKFDHLLNDKKYFNFVTAHPQGGNMMAADSFNERVVDTNFRVKDTENLFVCDASVFPRGIRVNPQWTIMALASEASEKISMLT